jgi:hypothetical protein
MVTFKNWVWMAGLISLFAFLAVGEAPSSTPKITLFNGLDLKAWKVPQGNDRQNWYQVSNRILKIQSGPQKKGSILWTEKEFKDFNLSLSFRFISGTIDSGIHLRNMDQIQIGIYGSKKRDMTCSPFIPGKGYPVEAKNIQKLLKPKDWNHLQIRAVGPKYTAWLQAEEVMNYKSSTAKEKGPIGIQLHANREMAIDFKAITIREL